MDPDVNKRLDDLESRIKKMEDYHPDITFKKEAVMHGIVRGIQQILIFATASAIATYLVIKFSK